MVLLRGFWRRESAVPAGAVPFVLFVTGLDLLGPLILLMLSVAIESPRETAEKSLTKVLMAVWTVFLSAEMLRVSLGLALLYAWRSDRVKS